MFIFFVSCFSRTCFYFSISFIECVCVLFWSILYTATALRSRASYIHSESHISTARIVCAFSCISLHKLLIVHLFIKIIFKRQNSVFVFFFLFFLSLFLSRWPASVVVSEHQIECVAVRSLRILLFFVENERDEEKTING